MPLRSPKMNRFILGFQRRVWWPKCTPASSSCFIVTTDAMQPPRLLLCPLRFGSRYLVWRGPSRTDRQACDVPRVSCAASHRPLLRGSGMVAAPARANNERSGGRGEVDHAPDVAAHRSEQHRLRGPGCVTGTDAE